MSKDVYSSPQLSRKHDAPKVSLNEVQEGLKVIKQKRLSRLSAFVAEQSRLFEERSQSSEQQNAKNQTANRLLNENYNIPSLNSISETSVVNLDEKQTKVEVTERLKQDSFKSSPKKSFLNKFNCVVNNKGYCSSDDETEKETSHAKNNKNLDDNNENNVHTNKLDEHSEAIQYQKHLQRKPIYFSDEFNLDSHSSEKCFKALPKKIAETKYEGTPIASAKKYFQYSSSSLPSIVHEANQKEENIPSQKAKFPKTNSVDYIPTSTDSIKNEIITGGNGFSEELNPKNIIIMKHEATSIATLKNKLDNVFSNSSKKDTEISGDRDLCAGTNTLERKVQVLKNKLSEEKSIFGVNKTDEFKLKYSVKEKDASLGEQKKILNLSKEEKLLKKLQINYSTVDKLLKSDTVDDCHIDSDEMEDFKNTLYDAKELLANYEIKIKLLDEKIPLQKLNHIRKYLEEIKEEINNFRGLSIDNLYTDMLNRLKSIEEELKLISNKIKQKQEISEYLKLCYILLEDRVNSNEIMLRDILKDLVEIISRRRIKETFL